MISIDFESGQIFIGQTSVSVKLTDEPGYLHLNYPDGPILRPLSVLERLRLIQYALTAGNAPAALAASTLHAATVKPGVGDYKLYQAVALHLAGGGLNAPPIYQAISMVARHTGWHPDEIFSADAAQIDHLASTLVPPSSSGWTRVLMLDAGQDELGAYADDLAASLIGRMDDRAGGDLSHAGHDHNDDSGYSSTEAQPLPRSIKGLQSQSKKALTGGSVFREPFSPRSVQTDRDQPLAFERPGGPSAAPEAVDVKIRGESNPADLGQSDRSPSTGSGTRSKNAQTADDMNLRSSPDAGFTLKKANGQRQNISAQSRPLGSIRSNDPRGGNDGPVLNLFRPDKKSAAAGVNPGRNSTRIAADEEHRGQGLTLQRHMDQTGSAGIGAGSLSTGDVRAAGRTEPEITDHPPAAERTLAGRHRPAPGTVRSGSGAWPGVRQHHGAGWMSDGLEQDIAAFFGHREASLADELADSLNREADLRGID